MTRNQVTKLLAVVALAASPAGADPLANRAPGPTRASAVANERAAKAAATPQTRAANPTGPNLPRRASASDSGRSASAASAASAASPASASGAGSVLGAVSAPGTAAASGSTPRAGLIELLARPRVLPSGAPACGNVASRAPRPVDCGRGRP